MKFRVASSIVMAGVACAAALVTASPAQAATRTCQGDQWKYDACFDGSNDAFYISDYVADGRRAVIKWNAYDGSGRSGECHDANGAMNGAVKCDYDFREGNGNYVAFQGMTRDGANGRDEDISFMVIGYITPR
ncbi:hypothetical protein [Streptomyces sp. HC307]|uniref:hypothetical protein n=1 Tax=Streptomyces flavusporus TaxID=3385496 RepID=UPI00391725CC